MREPAAIDTADFASGLLDPGIPVPKGVTGPDGKKADKRYDVYRNNVTVSLINSLAQIYPAVQRITGEAFFRAMARDYVRAHPPSSPLLFQYGHGFDAFIAAFEPAAHMPFLPQVAKTERDWLTAYHCADNTVLTPQHLACIAPETLADIRFEPHIAARFIQSEFPLFTIFAMNRDMMPLGRVDMNHGESFMLTRPVADILVTPLNVGQAAFFKAVFGGQSLGEAAVEGLEADEAFDINAALTTLLNTGCCHAIIE